MSQSVSELSRRLENALDTSYNVTDLPTVLEIIGVLESSRITIEQLESTQLTKCINHMRRRTADDTLARRSKNLIKRWRQMLPQVAPPNGRPAKRNGEVSRKRRRDDELNFSGTITEEEPKRRGRKKGSRGVDALMGDTVDTSPYLEFKHKVASGPKKVKTTKELLEDLQNRKLNSATSSPLPRPPSPPTTLHSDGSQSHEATAVETPTPEVTPVRVADIEEEICELRRQVLAVAAAQEGADDEVVEPQCTCTFTEIHETEEVGNGVTKRPTLGDGLNVAVTDGEASMGGRRPPVRSIFDLDETDDQGRSEIECVEEVGVSEGRGAVQWQCVEDPQCPARRECGDVTSEDVRALHSMSLEHVNGNWCSAAPDDAPQSHTGDLWERVVPQYSHLVQDTIPKCHEEGVRWRRKRRRSNNNNDDAKGVFREWFQTLRVTSYNDELLTILPYVVID